jgi:hypothetical protein
MITPSLVRTVWEKRYTLQKQKIWASFHIPRRLRHSKTNEQTIRVCTRPLGLPQGDTQGSTEARAELSLQVSYRSKGCDTKNGN